MASPTYASLLVRLECHLQAPLCLWTSSLFPTPRVPEYLYFMYAKMKVKALEVHFVTEVPGASPCIPIAFLWCLTLDANSCSCACCCRSSKVRRGPLTPAHFLWGYFCVALVHYHFCQLPLLCELAVIFKEASPLLSTVQNHFVTGALGIVTKCCIWFPGNLKTSWKKKKVHACSSWCNPGQMQVCCALNGTY